MIKDMRVLVIDQATINTSYNVIEVKNGKPQWLIASKISIRKGNSTQRMIEVRNRMQDVIDEYKITHLVVEDLNWSRKVNLNVTTVLCKMLGMLEILAEENNVEIVIMNILEWKSKAGIKSKTRDAQKAESIRLALRRFPTYAKIICKSDDVADALNMGIAFLVQKNIL